MCIPRGNRERESGGQGEREMERDREMESEREIERTERAEKEKCGEREGGHAYKNYNAYQFRITLESPRLVIHGTCSKMDKR